MNSQWGRRKCLEIIQSWVFFSFFIFIFREREGKEKEGEKHQCVVASHVLPTGDLAHNPGMCPENWTSNPLVCRLALNTLTHKRENNAASLALSLLSVTSSAPHKHIGLFWCWFLDGWVCVHSRTLWIFPMNCPVKLVFFSAPAASTDFYSQRSWGFILPCLNPGFCGLSCPPSCSSRGIHK